MKLNNLLAAIGTSLLVTSNLTIALPSLAGDTNKNIDRISQTNSEENKKESRDTNSQRDRGTSESPANILYNPPKSPKERQVDITRRTGSGIRGTCIEENSPQTLLAPSSHVGLTTQSHPRLAIYFPEAPKLKVSINIEDPEARKVIWAEEVEVNTAGIYSFKMPASAPELIPDRRYDWTVSLICDRNKRQVDIFAEVPLIRKEISPQLDRELSLAEDNIARARILARSGFFYDALGELLTSNSSQAKSLVNSLLAQTSLDTLNSSKTSRSSQLTIKYEGTN